MVLNEQEHDINDKITCASSVDTDQLGHPPSLIRVFAIRLKKGWVLGHPSSAQQDSDETERMPSWPG